MKVGDKAWCSYCGCTLDNLSQQYCSGTKCVADALQDARSRRAEAAGDVRRLAYLLRSRCATVALSPGARPGEKAAVREMMRENLRKRGAVS